MKKTKKISKKIKTRKESSKKSSQKNRQPQIEKLTEIKIEQDVKSENSISQNQHAQEKKQTHNLIKNTDEPDYMTSFQTPVIPYYYPSSLAFGWTPISSYIPYMLPMQNHPEKNYEN